MLRYAKLIVFMFSGMAWKRTSLTNSASTTPRAACEFLKKKLPALNLACLRYTKRVDDFFFCFFLAYLRLTGLLTTNEQGVSSKKGLPNIAMRTSATPNCLCVVLILYLVWMCAAGASSCPPYKCLRTFLHKSLLWLPQQRVARVCHAP